MTRYCIVRGCKSGLASDRKGREKKNLRQLSLFQVPKCNILRGKWEKALSQKLVQHQFVCEKHFRREDVLKDDRLVINGLKMILPRLKRTLVNNAVPISPHDLETDISLESENENSLLKVHHMERSTEVLEVNDEESDCQLEEFHRIYLPWELGVNDKTVSESSTPPLSINSLFTLREIQDYFSSVLTEGWCYFATETELTFVHINFHTRKEDRRFTIDENLSVKVSFLQRPEFSVDIAISSIDDIKNYIESVKKTVLCSGTGELNCRKFSKNCTGKVSNEEYKRWRQFPRCLECRKLHQKLLRRRCNKAIKSKQKIYGSVQRIRKLSGRLSIKVQYLLKRNGYKDDESIWKQEENLAWDLDSRKKKGKSEGCSKRLSDSSDDTSTTGRTSRTTSVSSLN